MNEEKLNLTFGALADPTRRAILSRLATGEATVGELAEPFLNEMSAPAITKHLKVLERAGLIVRRREAQSRPCKLEGQSLKEVSDWISYYSRFWEESFDRLDEYLKTIMKNKGKKRGKRKSAK